MAMKKTLAALALAALTTCGIAVQAQQPTPAAATQQREGTQSSQTAERARWQGSEQTFAHCLVIANQEEVALAKYGIEQTQNKDVKEFSEKLVEQHQQIIAKLQKFAPDAARNNIFHDEQKAATEESGVTRAGGAAAKQDRAIQQTSATSPGASTPDFVALHEEMARECLAQSKSELSKKDKTEFDQCFLGMQLAKHAAMKVQLTVLARHTDGDFKEVIQEALKTTEKHFEHGEKLMKQLAAADNAQQRRDRREERREERKDKAE